MGNLWPLGLALEDVSQPSGSQPFVHVAFYNHDGAWWLYVDGEDEANAVGYYELGVFGDGPLASYATELGFGGEVDGTTSWPPMGSGAFADAGYRHAAYQRDLKYRALDGTYHDCTGMIPDTPVPSLFKASLSDNSNPWNQTLFFGGPGGTVVDLSQLADASGPVPKAPPGANLWCEPSHDIEAAAKPFRGRKRRRRVKRRAHSTKRPGKKRRV